MKGCQYISPRGEEPVDAPRSPYCVMRSTFDRTLTCGNSRCSIALNDSIKIEMYFDASVT